MNRGAITLFIFLVILTSVTASSIDDEIQKVTNYAEDFESGNINYVQFLVHVSAVRTDMNEILGVADNDHGGTIEKDQLESAFGIHTEETKWVWVENENREIRVDEPLPVWRKLIFDGKEVQIELDAWPTVLIKDNEEKVFYRLHFNTNFKKDKEDINIEGKITEIANLAELFSLNPSRENAEELAKESVNAEKIFEPYLRQSSGGCSDILKNLLGSENKREEQKILVQQVTLYEGEMYDAIANVEMCDDCEWNWIWMDLRIEGRFPGKMPEENNHDVKRDDYNGYSDEDFKKEIRKSIEDFKAALAVEDFETAFKIKSEFWVINDAWGQQSNNVWEEVEKDFVYAQDTLTGDELQDYYDNYGWIKEEQEKRQRVNDLIREKFDEKVEFYNELFSSYDKKEYYFTQEQYEKRLVEIFKENGEEICNNNIDDNDNEQIDCGEDQCSGNICGQQDVEILEGNQTKTVVKDLYCIAGSCQLKEETDEDMGAVCGNNICEENEQDTCSLDCNICPSYSALNCTGQVIFKGEDANGCKLEPICLEEDLTCEIDTDCAQPLCGVSSCVENTCEVTELEECREEECVHGEKKEEKCESGDQIVTNTCIEGLWEETGFECEVKLEVLECIQCGDGCISKEQSLVASCLEPTGNFECVEDNNQCVVQSFEEETIECAVKEDCGGEDDVCSNGMCITIPKVVENEIDENKEETEEYLEAVEEIEVEEPVYEEEEHPQDVFEEPEPVKDVQEESPEENVEITGEIIRTIKSITGFITGLQIEEGVINIVDEEPEPEPVVDEEVDEEQEDDSVVGADVGNDNNEGEWDGQCPDAGNPPEVNDECWYEETYDDNGCVSGYDYFCNEHESDYGDNEPSEEDKNRENEERDREREENKEQERHKEEQKERCDEDCSRTCYDTKVRPCVDTCINDACGENLECSVDEEKEICENQCNSENDINICENECSDKCMEGDGEWWKEYEEERKDQEEEHKEQQGVFTVGGSCRTSQGKTEGNLWFNGWGDPFDDIQELKNKYYSGGHSDWCKEELKSVIEERKELEDGLDQEFVTWFFEKYLVNGADEWEQHSSGIYELYWEFVENSRRMSESMNCLGLEELPPHTLVNVNYETDYGKLEFWEEIKQGKIHDESKEVMLISPYMKIWIFPPQEFVVRELQGFMEKGEFPGSSEGEDAEILSEEDKVMLKSNEGVMKRIRKLTEDYEGNLDIVFQFKDYETEEIVFNVYVNINEEDIFNVKPMPPGEVPGEDVKIIVDFERVYDMIHESEQEMSGERLERPPWDHEKGAVEGIKEAVDGLKMFLKIRSIVNDAEVYPEEREDVVNDLVYGFMRIMMVVGDEPVEEEKEEIKDVLESSGIDLNPQSK